MLDKQVVETIQQRVAQQREKIIAFMREICAIPSMNSLIGPVGERIAEEMRKLGFEDVRFDKMGNIYGHIGSGSRVLVYDSHIDTVGVGDPAAWGFDPFTGKLEGDKLIARGTVDEKGSTPGMIYGLALAHELGLLDGWTAYYFGNMEEWCDGIGPNAFVEVDPAVRPDMVVIGEPTSLNIYRGHKGRIELSITARGKSAHAASNHLGDNAIYRLLPVIAAIRDLEPQLGNHPFLGHGKITVSDMKVQTASINAVPDEATIFIDRSMTFGETKEAVVEQIKALIPPEDREFVSVVELFYDEPSYTGYVFPVEKYYPAWALDESHPLVQAGVQARRIIGLPEAPTGKWDFSTNGTYWAGKAGIPSIGFGPGDELQAHTTGEWIDLNEVVKATEFYAVLPGLL
ncbi:MAG: YgeY family selenium metabolism-linked hydrolase [Anaerolineae bacterium]|nr:YgeY family selenium metabolism-linked hydrolase [Anaerolineae bacterium]